MSRREDHHLFHDRLSWEARDDAWAIRQDKGHIVPLEHDPHVDLHRNTPIVPLLSYHALRRVHYNLPATTSNYLENLDQVLKAIQEATTTPRAHYVETQLGQLTCHVLELQKPYIEDSLVPSDYGKLIIL